jgi:hypothetical protein
MSSCFPLQDQNQGLLDGSRLCDDSASTSIGDKHDRVEPELASFRDNVTGQYVMTYEYAKLDLLYTIFYNIQLNQLILNSSSLTPRNHYRSKHCSSRTLLKQ